MRTEVAIIGAGPAGLLLAHLLDQHGVESIVVETRSQEYVAARIRAGILEHSSVELLRSVGLGANIDAHGHEHRGIHLQWPHERHTGSLRKSTDRAAVPFSASPAVIFCSAGAY